MTESEAGDFAWVRLTESGLSAQNEGRPSGFCEEIERAHLLAGGFGEGDPRRASSLSNLGACRRLAGELGEAEHLYGEALAAWQAGSRWVDGMRLTQRARSSLFHLRMERRHRSGYDRRERDRCRALLGAGEAATLNNLAELCHRRGCAGDAEDLYRRALEARTAGLGIKDPGVARIEANLVALREGLPGPLSQDALPTADASAGRASFREEAVRQRWIVDVPPEFTDEGRLMAAVLLAWVIPAAGASG